MINFSVLFKNNEKAELLEQAAGFPPFTRGYSTVSKLVQISDYSKTVYTLPDFSNESIVQLFSKIISREAKEKQTLSIPFTGSIDEVILVSVLRTILSFISNTLYNNPSIIQFEFYGANKNEIISLNTLFYANTAQLDFLMTRNVNDWELIKRSLSEIPVDSLYGSNYIEKETSTLFFSLWKQIKALLM